MSNCDVCDLGCRALVLRQLLEILQQSATISGVIGVRGVIFLFSSLDKKARYSSLRRAPCRFATRKNSIDLMNVCVTIS